MGGRAPRPGMRKGSAIRNDIASIPQVSPSLGWLPEKSNRHRSSASKARTKIVDRVEMSFSDLSVLRAVAETLARTLTFTGPSSVD